jgi:hypothetical protein
MKTRKPDPIADACLAELADITARRRANDRRGRDALAKYESVRPPSLPPVTPPPRDSALPTGR